MDKNLAAIISFLAAYPNHAIILLVANPLGGRLSTFLEVTGTPQECVTVYLGMESLARTIRERPATPDAPSEFQGRCLVYHSDPTQLHELGWAIADAAEANDYSVKTSYTRSERMRSGQVRFLRIKDGVLEFSPE